MNNFNDFPKKRPILPNDYKKIYKSNYKENREGQTFFSSLSLKAESWQHVQAAKDILQSPHKTTLEIGAGTLNHLPYEPDTASYDIIEPQKELYENSELLGHVRNIYSDINEIPPSSKYDRIVSCNAFEHICNLPEVVAYCGLLLEKDGVMRIGVPSEGTFLWTLTWKLTRGIEFKLKHGLDYDVLMKYEHVNTAREVENVLRYFFRKIQTKVLGINKSLSLYQFYTCTEPIEKKCIDYSHYINKSIKPKYML
jgi:hypothetical protein